MFTAEIPVQINSHLIHYSKFLLNSTTRKKMSDIFHASSFPTKYIHSQNTTIDERPIGVQASARASYIWSGADSYYSSCFSDRPFVLLVHVRIYMGIRFGDGNISDSSMSTFYG